MATKEDDIDVAPGRSGVASSVGNRSCLVSSSAPSSSTANLVGEGATETHIGTNTCYSDKVRSLLIGREYEANLFWQAWGQVVEVHRQGFAKTNAKFGNTPPYEEEEEEDEDNHNNNDEKATDGRMKSRMVTERNNNEETEENEKYSFPQEGVVAPTTKKHTCLIEVHGQSGVGKSHLVESLRGRVVEETNGIFVASKFDQGSRFPFHVIVDVLSDVCDVLSARPDADTVLEGLLQVMGAADWAIFTQYVSVPSHFLSRVMKEEDADDEQASASSSNTQNNLPTVAREYSVEPFKRIKRASRKFLGYVATIQPLLIFFDDMQWADHECRDVIESLLAGATEERNAILYVVSVRLEPNRRNSNSKTAFFNYATFESTTTRLLLQNWNLIQVQEYISKLLSMPMEEIKQSRVGSIALEKTGGNPFFVSQFLELLRIKKLLVFSSSSQQWEFTDLKEIFRQDVSDGVLSSVDARIYDLSPSTRSILVLAAHLGYEIKMDVLIVVGKEYQRRFERQKKRKTLLVEDAIAEAENANLILRARDGKTFYFMHDRVQESLYEMVSDGHLKERLYLRIGRWLKPEIDELVEKGEDRVILIVADAMNAGSKHITKHEELLEVMHMNIQASEMAASIGSFVTAAAYLEVAMSLVPGERLWRENYRLSKDMHEKLALMKCHCGDVDAAHHTIDTIMQRASSMLDKQTAFEIRFLAYNLQGNKQILPVALSALRELGLELPENPTMMNLVLTVLRIQWAMRGRRPNDLHKLEVGEDRQAAFVGVLLRHVALQAGMIGKDLLWLYATAEGFLLTLKTGKTKTSSMMVAGYGVLQYAIFRNIDKAEECGRVANRMLSDPEAAEDIAFTRVLTHFALSWQEPLYTLIRPLKEAFDFGVMTGDTYNAGTCLGLGLFLQFISGLPLVQIEQEMEDCFHRNSEFAGEDSDLLLWTNCVWQTVLNLLGRCDNHLTLTGKAMREEDMVIESVESVPVLNFLNMKIQLACHYHSVDHAAPLLQGLEGNMRVYEVFPVGIATLKFFMAMSYVDLIKDRPENSSLKGLSKRACVGRVKKIHRFFQKVSSHRCHFTRALIGLLEAELQCIRTGAMIPNLFDGAIETALSSGYVNFAALGCERAAFALMATGRDSGNSQVLDYLSRALSLNEKWEAVGKVMWLEEKFPSLQMWRKSEKNSNFDIPKSITAILRPNEPNDQL